MYYYPLNYSTTIDINSLYLFNIKVDCDICQQFLIRNKKKKLFLCDCDGNQTILTKLCTQFLRCKISAEFFNWQNNLNRLKMTASLNI